MAKLSYIQEQFCHEYVNCHNLAEAYFAAGYKAKSDAVARASASRLLTKDKIRCRVQELQDKINDSRIMSARERQELLTATIRNDYESNGQIMTQTGLKALDILNKMSGDYVNNVSIDNNVSIVLSDDIKE